MNNQVISVPNVRLITGMEIGNCDICGTKKVPVRREYYYYDIKCECHSPQHFDLKYICANCKATPPETTRIHINVHELNDILIRLKQYGSLRLNFAWLTKKVLGKDYYNDGMDVYMTDRIVCEDIYRRFLELQNNRRDLL